MSWTKPQNTYGKIVKYVVYYRETAKEDGYIETIVENGSRVLLTSLEVYTDYSIYVQAFTVAGGGKWSETKIVKSGPGSKEVHFNSHASCSCSLKTL